MRRFLLSVMFLCAVSTAEAQERRWELQATDVSAFLVFGVPETDDIGLTFFCDMGKPNLSLIVETRKTGLRRGQTVPMVISIDGKPEKLPAKITFDVDTQKLTARAPLAFDGATFRALQSGNSLTVDVAGHASIYPLNDADFFGLSTYCRGDASSQ